MVFNKKTNIKTLLNVVQLTCFWEIDIAYRQGITNWSISSLRRLLFVALMTHCTYEDVNVHVHVNQWEIMCVTPPNTPLVFSWNTSSIRDFTEKYAIRMKFMEYDRCFRLEMQSLCRELIMCAVQYNENIRSISPHQKRLILCAEYLYGSDVLRNDQYTSPIQQLARVDIMRCLRNVAANH